MAKFKLTIRNGPKVVRESHRSLDESLAALRSHAQAIRAEGGLGDVTMFRTYEAGDRVKARLEISTGGMLRGRDAGVDVMGDGGMVPFRGGVVRRPLAPTDGDDPFEAIAVVLREGTDG
jgi:hypothetical protein